MNLLTVLDLSLAYSGKTLFDRVGFQVDQGERIGLVGPNGSGKTSLLRLLTSEVSPDRGEIRKADGLRIGYLLQDVHEVLSGPILRAVLDSIPGRVLLREEIASIERGLEKDLTKREQEMAAARLAEKHQEMSYLDTQFPHHRAEKILEGLGFKTSDLDRPLSTLSGGWKMRVALASILYQDPDLLLLDEPTNHLDIPSVRWLEQFLQEFRGAMILICHDRDFLNRQVRRIIGFEPGGLRYYSGNYDAYLKVREEERKALEARARNQEMKIKEAKRFIERFKAKATKARQAQSKIKLLEKTELVKTHRSEKVIHFSFPEVARSGEQVVNIQGVSKGFQGKALYRDLHLTVRRGERVAVIGPNGAGKTTLLRMVAGELDPDEGHIVLGHGVSMNYYAQHHSETLNPKKTVLEEVGQVVPYETFSYVRGICGAFLFSGDDVDKSVGVLSGGEKARVCLARILVKPGNLLIMDEPTNHLDILSSEKLIDALKDYNGTMLFVSHNQAFVSRLATKIWDITEDRILEYPGTLYEYYDHLARKDHDLVREAPAPGTPRKPGLGEAPDSIRSNRKLQRREKAIKRHQIRATLQPIEDKLSELEARIAELEKREGELGTLLADQEIFRDQNRSLPILREYSEVREKLRELMGRWEHHQGRLESVKRELEV